jgi:hypothetical protein
MEDCQKKLKLCQTNLYSDDYCRSPKVYFVPEIDYSECSPRCFDEKDAERIESSAFKIAPKDIDESSFFKILLKTIKMTTYQVTEAYNKVQKDNNRKHLNELQEQINNKLKDVSLIFNQIFAMKELTYSFKVEIDRDSILFVIHRGEAVMVLEEQSTGFRYFFDLFFYLHKDLHKSLFGSYLNDIIVMDEPGAHLHSAAQKGLRAFLKEFAYSNEITIVMATHNQYFIDLDHLDELRIIENKDNVVRIHNCFTAVNYGDPDSLLPIKEALTVENWMIIDPSKTIVFVEGITDYNYLTAFKLLFENEYENIIFLPINGVGSDENHCKEISKRLLKIRKDAKVLVDNDTAGKRMKEINAKDSELKVVSLDEIDKNFTEIESLFSKEDLRKC